MLIYAIEISKTAASGAWSFNTVNFNAALLKQIIVKAATATNTFNFTITDNKDNVVYDSSDTGGKATGTLRAETNIPLKGIYTLAVANAFTDEAFTGRLMIREK